MPAGIFGRSTTLALIAAVTAACSMGGRSANGPLGFNALGCKSRETLAAVHANAEQFQRAADDQLASGGCRVFASGQFVHDKRSEQGLIRFADPKSGTLYWAERPG